MKLKFCFLLLLCPIFRVWAQENITAKGLQPGDKVPDLRLAISNHQPTYVHLSDFHEKVLILDFWATWCAPCRVMIRKGDSLNTAFAGKALILPVTYETEQLARPVLTSIRKRIDRVSPEIFHDSLLHRLFPHQSLPHYVWIDGTGTVQALTEAGEVNANAITAALAGQFPTRQKIDLSMPYTDNQPLLVDGNGGTGQFLRYHSMLAGYIPGLTPGTTITRYDTVKGQKFNVRNVPMLSLLRMAFGDRGRYFAPSQFIIQTKDSLSLTSKLTGSAYTEWLSAGHGYTYELLLPPALATRAYPIMHADIDRLFPQYKVSVVRKDSTCLVLVKTCEMDHFRSAGGEVKVAVTPFGCELHNSSLAQLLMRLSHQYLQLYPHPILDGTGYKGRVDIEFSASMSNVAAINAGLAPYGLKLVEKNAQADFLQVADNPDYLQTKP
ncbi:TlpA family protein disulfide reductase [Mucilaginibacter agri]|uniref:Redoxin domain-containing protein n=1 Tax=Mucilaginibacter agri TaxID=2695265 RepID=A0A966DTX1_9SPHI|nr:TlpA disulfide reductase family protein [Mucilaginibacter agri]NCD69099.1 redoxin domain-containing protein [Mucilaginibacter agri]